VPLPPWWITAATRRCANSCGWSTLAAVKSHTSPSPAAVSHRARAASPPTPFVSVSSCTRPRVFVAASALMTARANDAGSGSRPCDPGDPSPTNTTSRVSIGVAGSQVVFMEHISLAVVSTRLPERMLEAAQVGSAHEADSRKATRAGSKGVDSGSGSGSQNPVSWTEGGQKPGRGMTAGERPKRSGVGAGRWRKGEQGVGGRKRWRRRQRAKESENKGHILCVQR
jgi:hypothetical protein